MHDRRKPVGDQTVICSPFEETSRIVRVISSSVSESNAEVASSKISSGGFRSKARAMDNRCFSPAGQIQTPFTDHRSNPFSARASKAGQEAFRRASSGPLRKHRDKRTTNFP